MSKIAFISAFITLGTGYAQDTLNMANGLMERGHEVIQCATQYTGFPITVNGIKIYAGATDDEIRRSLLATKPDYVVVYADLWMYTPFSNFRYYKIKGSAHEAGSKIVNFSPLHSAPVPKEFEASIDTEGDFTLFTSKWASDYFRSRGHENVDYLHLPVNPDFKHIDIERKKRPFNLPSGTMMMHVGMSIDQRKMTPLVLLLLKNYLFHDQSAFAYLHTRPRSYFANDVYAYNLGLEKEQVRFQPYEDESASLHGLQNRDLNLLYNSSDMYINLSSSEGYDKPALEAASLGVPVLVTDSYVHREVLKNYHSAQYVDVIAQIPEPVQWESLADVDDALQKMLSLHEKDFRKSKPHVETEHTIPYVAERLEKILFSI